MLFGALLATTPIWQSHPDFAGAELALLVAIVLVVPVSWVFLARGPGRLASVLLIASVLGWSLMTRLWASWATPPTVDDVLRGYLAVGCAIVVTALWIEGRRSPIGRRPRLALLSVAAAALVLLPPVVGDASTPDGAALRPLPPGVVLVAEDAGCESRGSCERRFELTADDGAGPDEVARRLIRHLEDRGWGIGAEYEDKACRRLGYLANPYRACVSVLRRRSTGTVEVLFEVFNPREPRTVYS